MSARATVASRAPKYLPSWPAGGLLVVGGPPLGGKGPLAARLEETLPNTIKLASIDNLAELGQQHPRRAIHRDEIESELLREALRAWKRHDGIPPLVIVCGRFGTSILRRMAKDFADQRGMRFLLAEATASPIRSLRRVCRLALSPAETTRRIERYDRARKSYQPVSRQELHGLPAISLKGVLSDLDGAAERVTRAWLAG